MTLESFIGAAAEAAEVAELDSEPVEVGSVVDLTSIVVTKVNFAVSTPPLPAATAVVPTLVPLELVPGMTETKLEEPIPAAPVYVAENAISWSEFIVRVYR